ncbi:MAG: UDP-N-acetylmuramate:L-alanyl-gamma-D-glutamyl-meso-diaminopimelate ligase (EC [uncultured Thiotrichaceae bacterium]|uniref:UDP-N-acetylmuramate--L-alanyl-gamma-D-glutamyl-meso-2,6-diaminoheptandioate ligase n=1 Tax=uncultured Thiotrichaceae bacterium TaxID=298394 RepID=A0A6S6T688_9GAMM|nr:MAG: UDP-N-acetylmuramate:L-alanyl-gamma-D-glutamyl-meso-diaminopimelate ligase (EC [uncultured Thiotrichaceae bacterium]
MGIHILGICGTFMGGIALLARESGIVVSGSDENVYPPMSTMLEEQGVTIQQGLKSENLPDDESEQIVVGNVMTRGMPVIEDVLDRNLPYTSGPQWLYENILRDKWVLAVAGTHGKTTTASMLAWVLEYAGMKPGFLIGGVPENFGLSARLGESPFFVVEADEYDTAFFDKRSKFVHYHPRTLVLNNLEYDHADIFPNIDAIKTQFHHLMRIVPGSGRVMVNATEPHLQDVIEMGCWTETEAFTSDASSQGWSVEYIEQDGSAFNVLLDGEEQGEVRWNEIGKHNVANGLAAIAAARHAGVPVKHAIAALAEFKGVKRRMQLRGEVDGVKVYDDFAHHPTAITTTLQGLRKNVADRKITAILEPRSNTMRLGSHKENLPASLMLADEVLMYQPADVDWDMQSVIDAIGDKAQLFHDVDAIIQHVVKDDSADSVLIMSNGGFGGIHDRLLDALGNPA